MYSSEALFSAVRAGDCEMMERLIRGGASTNAQDEVFPKLYISFFTSQSVV